MNPRQVDTQVPCSSLQSAPGLVSAQWAELVLLDSWTCTGSWKVVFRILKDHSFENTEMFGGYASAVQPHRYLLELYLHVI